MSLIHTDELTQCTLAYMFASMKKREGGVGGGEGEEE